MTWANEISWSVDGGAPFPEENYADFSVNDHRLDLSIGEHSFEFVDSFGDGWHGGYWTLIDSAGTEFDGGSINGLVNGAGRQISVTMGSDGTAEAAMPHDGDIILEDSWTYIGCYNDPMGNRDLGSTLPNGGADEGHYFAVNSYYPHVSDLTGYSGPIDLTMEDLYGGYGTELCFDYCAALGYQFMG
jgi:hypothetical protein